MAAVVVYCWPGAVVKSPLQWHIMAEGGQDVLDLSSLGKSLPPTGMGQGAQPGAGVAGLEITILSWNINGPGEADLRNYLVPRVVSHANPDVLLLQEVPSDKIINHHIIPQCNQARGRSYQCVNGGKRTEARVLYDSRVFELCMPGGTSSAKMNLSALVAEIFPPQWHRETRGGQRVSEEELFRDRVAAVRLRHKATGKVIVFMSFHNIRRGGGKDAVTRMATGFCQIVSRTAKQEHENTLVVAGADLNCSKFSSHETVHILPYFQTPRRSSYPKVDYCLSAWPGGITVRGRVSPLDVFPADESDSTHQFSQVFRDLQRAHSASSVADYSHSLNHDPLVYTLSIR